MEFREVEPSFSVEESISPEKTLGITEHANLEELEQAFARRMQGLLDELIAGQSGEGLRVIPQQEYEARLAEIQHAYQTLKARAAAENEIDTQELDPNFPNQLIK